MVGTLKQELFLRLPLGYVKTERIEMSYSNEKNNMDARLIKLKILFCYSFWSENYSRIPIFEKLGPGYGLNTMIQNFS